MVTETLLRIIRQDGREITNSSGKSVETEERELKMEGDRKYGNTEKSVYINQGKEVDVGQQWTLKGRKGSGVCI